MNTQVTTSHINTLEEALIYINVKTEILNTIVKLREEATGEAEKNICDKLTNFFIQDVMITDSDKTNIFITEITEMMTPELDVKFRLLVAVNFMAISMKLSALL
jgi:hypothetical protein